MFENQISDSNKLGFYFIFVSCVFADKSGIAGGTQRRQRLAQDFLVWMDQTGELLSLAERHEVDPVKQERMEVRGYHDVFSHDTLAALI